MTNESRNETKGIVFNIQKFSTDDGPGIRTTVFLKGCPLSCLWCANPESQSRRIEPLWHAKSCRSCRRCIEVCPESAMTEKSGIVVIDRSRCSGCGICARSCPSKALTMEGMEQSVAEVVRVCLQDLPFYEESGGGVTLSGGEILMQPVFSRALLRALKEEGIHTAAETTGFASADVFVQTTADVDLLLFDMKHWDRTRHIEGTGVPNDLPLSNMKAAIAAGKDVLPRLPIIPGFNDSAEDAYGFARVLRAAGAAKCQLLPFHPFGENKYALLGRKYAYEGRISMKKEALAPLLSILQEERIAAFM